MHLLRLLLSRHKRTIIVTGILIGMWVIINETAPVEDRRPEIVDKHLQRAEAYIFCEDFKSAGAELKKAAKADNHRARTYAVISLMLARNHMFKSSLSYAYRAAKTAEKERDTNLQAEAWNLVYICNDALNRSSEAAAALERALKLKPTNTAFQNNLAYTYAEQGVNLHRALKLSKMSLRRQPFNGNYVDTLGWIYFKLGDKKLALRTVKRAARLSPGDPTIRGHLAEIEKSLGMLAAAGINTRKIKILNEWWHP